MCFDDYRYISNYRCWYSACVWTWCWFTGFYSKDIIIESAFASDRLFADLAFYIGVFVAFLTSFYSWRLIFLVFFGVSRGDDKVHAHA